MLTDASDEEIVQPTILDLQRLQNYMIGLTSFDAAYQYVAADMNRDRSINSFDVLALRDHLIGVTILGNEAFSTYVEAESVVDSWRDYKTEISYMNYDGSFDLLHIGLQDMYINADESVQGLLVDQNVANDKTILTLTNEVAITTEGIEMAIALPKGLAMEQISLSSDILNIASNQYHYNTESGKLKFVSLNTVELEANEAWMHIVVDSEIDLIEDINVNWIKDDILVRSEIHSQPGVDVDDELLGLEDLLISNVVSDVLMINDNVLLGRVNVYDMRGLLVYTAINNNNRIDATSLSPGLYILQWTDGQALRESKFVKK